MHIWNNAYEGRTEHCCFCIPVDIGACILGLLVVLGTILNVVAFIGVVFETPAASVSPILSALLTAYPALMFLLMFKELFSEDSRKNYAKAYQIMVKITNVLVILSAIVLLALSIWGFIRTGSVVILGTGIASLLGFALVFFLNIHFNRVVQTFAELQSFGGGQLAEFK